MRDKKFSFETNYVIKDPIRLNVNILDIKLVRLTMNILSKFELIKGMYKKINKIKFRK